MPTLQDKINKFNARYDVQLSEVNVRKNLKMQYLDDFLFEKTETPIQRKEEYFVTLNKFLQESIMKKAMINENGYYDMTDFDLADFLREFEDIAQTATPKLRDGSDRKAYEGMSYEGLLKLMKANVKKFETSLPDVWVYNVVKGGYSYEDLQRVTEGAKSKLENVAAEDLDEAKRKDLANILHAHTAMGKIWESRSIFFILRHPVISYKEYQYTKELKALRDEYVGKNYPVEEIEKNVPANMMEAVYKRTDRSVQSKASLEAQKKVEKIMQEKEEKRREISNVAEKLQPVADNAETKEKLVGDIVKKLPAGKNTILLKSILKNVAVKSLMDTAQEANHEFDECVAAGLDKNKMMENTVHKVFAKAYSLTDSLGYYDMGDKLAAAQAMTDALMKNLSPATLEPEAYANFANGYVFNNPGKFDDVTEMNGTEPVFMDAKKAYAEMSRESLEINEMKPMANEAVVPPVQQAPSIEAPVVSVSKN